MIWVAGIVLVAAILAGAVRAWLTLAFTPSESLVYRDVEGIPLSMHIFEPAHTGERRRPAIVFFFGGGWSIGTAAQFFPFCRYFADRGFVAFSAQYRIRLRHGTGISAALSDARAAVQWVCKNAAYYRIDPARIVLSGGSSGGHLAAAVAMIPAGSGSVPPIAALVLFNPVTDLSGGDAPRAWRLIARFVLKRDQGLSPIRHVTSAAPPTLIFHGDADSLVPLAQSKRFRDAMHACNSVCDLKIYSGSGHAFFNYGLGHFEEIGAAISGFIERLGRAS